MAHMKFLFCTFFIWIYLSAASSLDLGNCFDGNRKTQCDMNRVEIFGEYYECMVQKRFPTPPQLINKDNKLYFKLEQNTFEYDLKTNKFRRTVDIRSEPAKIFKHKNFIFSSLTGKAIVKTDEKNGEQVDIFTSNECQYDQIELHPESNTLFILSHDKNGQEMEKDGVLYFLNTTNIENLQKIPVSEKIDTKNQKFTTFLVYGNNLILSGKDQIGGKLMIIPLIKSNPCKPIEPTRTRSPVNPITSSRRPLIDCKNIECLAPLCQQNKLDVLIKKENEHYNNLVIMMNTLKNKLKDGLEKSDIVEENCLNEKNQIKTLTMKLDRCNSLLNGLAIPQPILPLPQPPAHILSNCQNLQCPSPPGHPQILIQVQRPYQPTPQFPFPVPQPYPPMIQNQYPKVDARFPPNSDPIVNLDRNFPFSSMIACRNSLIKLKNLGIVDDKEYQLIWKACGADVFENDDNDGDDSLEKMMK